MLRPVEVGEGARHHVAILELRSIGQRLEQPPAHDLEALLGAGRPPRGFDTAHDVAQPVERLAPALAAHLHVIGPGVGRAGGVRGGQADDEQAVLRQLGRFGEHLGEGELGLEAACRKVTLVVELTRIGHPLVDQDEAGAILLEQLAQRIAGAGRPFVVGVDAGKGRLTPELPGQLAPQRAHHGAVGLDDRVAGRDLVAHQHHAADGRQRLGVGLLHDRIDAGQLAGCDTGEEVIERQHGVGLAAAEVGLELHHRIAAAAGETPHRAHQHGFQALGEVGAAEELDRVAILVRPFAQVHLPEVGGELSLLVAAAGHVAMGRHHLAPRLEAARDLALDGRARALALFAPHLLIEAQTQQFQFHLFDVIRLWRGNGRQQPGGGIQAAIGVVGGEGLLVRPLVAHLAQLADEAAFREAQRLPEDRVPLVPHHPQQHGRIHLRLVLAFPPDQLVRPRLGGLRDPILAVFGFPARVRQKAATRPAAVPAPCPRVRSW